jgi:hypothetical protein
LLTLDDPTERTALAFSIVVFIAGPSFVRSLLYPVTSSLLQARLRTKQTAANG